MEVALDLKPNTHKEFLVFCGLTINMGLIISESVKTFWNTKDWSHESTSFPVNEGDSRKLKKAEELLQHFSEQCSHYVLKQILTYKH